MKSLFNAKTISRLCGNVVISDVQRSGAEKWLRMLADGELYDERHNYINFYQIILHDILGYDETDIKYEENNVEFQIKSADRKPILCCETKGTRIADLYADQHRPKKEHRTPIDQTHYYMYRLDLEYGLCTNYNKFVLLDRNKNAYEFDFELIQSSKSKLKEFVGMFSKTNVLSGFFENVRHESELEEREFTKQFYKLFHETRLMMIKEFSQNAEKSIAVHHTQIILNRLVFIFFAADRDLVSDRRLFYNRLIGIFKSNTITDTSQKVFDDIRDVFTAFDKGSKMPEIFSYNGGLFSDEMPPDIYFKDIQNKNLFANLLQDSKLSKQKLNQDAENAIKSITNLNPIIRNLMIMESFNFNTEVSVNILGHIFEQSISDLETIEGKAASQRKKSGIYYTPRHITDYICRNTIIPYLSKSGMADTVFALMDEYNDAGGISDLEQKFREIKILDPACGSGAFILPAVGILLDIGKAIINHKQSRGLYTVGEQSLLTKWSEESEMERIIENNVYGVDIYRQSIEITKLSLCLELVSKNRKLPDLGKNFRIGNSVVDNEKIDSQAFDWDNEFLDVMKGGGFGVVIGNPPYVKSRDNIIGVKMKKSIEERFVSAFAMWDLYVPFMELGLMLLKNDGWFAMIVKDTLGEANYTKKLIELIENKYHLHQIDFFPGIMLFEGVGVENKIPFIQNSKKTTLAKRILHNTPSTTGVKLKSVSGEKNMFSRCPSLQ